MPEVPNESGILSEPLKSDGPGPRIMAADSLTGEKVVNQQGETLGHVTHIMLDIVSGTIVYAALSFGGVLGVGDKLFAVPWTSLALDVDNKWFVLNIELQRFRNAPGFDKSHWPSMADLQWVSHVEAYYGPDAPSRRPFI